MFVFSCGFGVAASFDFVVVFLGGRDGAVGPGFFFSLVDEIPLISTSLVTSSALVTVVDAVVAVLSCRDGDEATLK